MFIKLKSLFRSILSYSFIIIPSIIAISIFIFAITERINNCYEVTIIYIDFTTETFHCDFISKSDTCLTIDFDRNIVLSSIREYSYIVVKCGCVEIK